MSPGGYGAAVAPGPDAGLGTKFSEAIKANSRDNQLPSQELSEDGRKLLHALKEAYMDTDFQAEVHRLRASHSADELRFLTSLGPLAAKVQAPVFEQFGLPPGQRGVILMKMGVRLLSMVAPDIKELAGDLREMLCLPREEEDISSTIKKAESEFQALERKIASAPLDVRGPLAEAFLLPYKASPREIAQAIPGLQKRAKELAKHHMARGRDEIIGEGKLLGADMAHASEEVLQEKVQDLFERYLQKMLSRVITPLDSFTRPAADFSCSWAQELVSHEVVQDLWGSGRRHFEDLSHLSDLSGVAILDHTVTAELISRARLELAQLELAGEVTASKDPCNVGACSVWLHLDSTEEKEKVPPALRDLCDRLLGLPDALLSQARQARGEPLQAPQLRVHPHIMAATYRPGAEYHCHKDSYSGTDNQRSVTILLYLNDWQPGDGGELRLFAPAKTPAATAPALGSSGLLKESATAPDHERFVDLAPLSGRIVMFRSREVWHAVREPRLQRWALTLWVMAD